MNSHYRGRFAPSPTGPLHAGSLAAALASWLDARSNGGNWLIRIEDIDPPRAVVSAVEQQLAALGALGLRSDEPVLYQSTRGAAYEAALEQLQGAGLIYRCSCSRSRLASAKREPGAPPGVYPGTCRRRPPPPGPAAMRVRVPDETIVFEDQALGRQEQQLAREVGDFVVRRADGLWAYQLAVVVDDAFQRISHVVRGADLLDNTARQIYLQRALGLPTPCYRHIPLVLDPYGAKLSKQTGAAAIDASQPLLELERAWRHLGFEPTGAGDIAGFQRRAIEAWRLRTARVDRIAAAHDPGTGAG
jgi:glutamyl-Q tRNA(Asp) synthetase